MSGGRLYYFYSDLESHVGDFKDKELDELVKDLAKLFYEREWYLSGDTCEGNWNEARDNFKTKWFSDIGRQERFEKCLEDFKKETLDSFGIEHNYCKNCKHWKETDKPYGECSYEKRCLMHRCETCDKFDRR